MITPQVAQLIAEERIADRIRSAQTAHLVRIARGNRPSTWTRVTHGVGGRLPRLSGVLHRGQAPAARCLTC